MRVSGLTTSYVMKLEVLKFRSGLAHAVSLGATGPLADTGPSRNDSDRDMWR